MMKNSYQPEQSVHLWHLMTHLQHDVAAYAVSQYDHRGPARGCELLQQLNLVLNLTVQTPHCTLAEVICIVTNMRHRQDICCATKGCVQLLHEVTIEGSTTRIPRHDKNLCLRSMVGMQATELRRELAHVVLSAP